MAIRAPACLLVLMLTIAGPDALAQGTTSALLGTVRDSARAPVVAATILAARMSVTSDSAGRFALEGLPAGRVTVSVRRLGYEPANLVLDLVAGRRDSLFVTLVALPLTLPGLTSTADAYLRLHLADFFRHRENGVGRYYERSQITAMRVGQLSDVMRRMPGVRVSPDRNGRYTLRMGRSTRNCQPDFWVDNVRAHMLNVDDIPVTDIEALEVYNGPSGLPPEYNNRFGNPACGAIVIWTRVPG